MAPYGLGEHAPSNAGLHQVRDIGGHAAGALWSL